MPDQNHNDASTGRRNPADNLTGEARRKGGKNSAQMQRRDQHGQFAGRKSESSSASAGSSDSGRSAGEDSGRSANQGGS